MDIMELLVARYNVPKPKNPELAAKYSAAKVSAHRRVANRSFSPSSVCWAFLGPVESSRRRRSLALVPCLSPSPALTIVVAQEVPIHLRIFNFLKNWIEKYWVDFYEDGDLRGEPLVAGPALSPSPSPRLSLRDVSSRCLCFRS